MRPITMKLQNYKLLPICRLDYVTTTGSRAVLRGFQKQDNQGHTFGPVLKLGEVILIATLHLRFICKLLFCIHHFEIGEICDAIKQHRSVLLANNGKHLYKK